MIARWACLAVWVGFLAWWLVGVLRWHLARGDAELRLERIAPIIGATVGLLLSAAALELAVHS